MKRLWLFSGIAALLLNSATPPPTPASAPSIARPSYIATATRPFETPVEVPPPETAVAAAPPALQNMERPAQEPEPDEAPVVVQEAAPADSGLAVVVSIPQQRAYVFDDGELIASSPVSTGKKGHETPVGTFSILQKKVRHRSNRYDNAPMPFMQRLTWYGVALHAGSVPGYPASHGCIRLPRSFAKKLYGMTDHGTKVVVTNRRLDTPDEARGLA